MKSSPASRRRPGGSRRKSQKAIHNSSPHMNYPNLTQPTPGIYGGPWLWQPLAGLPVAACSLSRYTRRHPAPWWAATISDRVGSPGSSSYHSLSPREPVGSTLSLRRQSVVTDQTPTIPTTRTGVAKPFGRASKHTRVLPMGLGVGPGGDRSTWSSDGPAPYTWWFPGRSVALAPRPAD